MPLEVPEEAEAETVMRVAPSATGGRALF